MAQVGTNTHVGTSPVESPSTTDLKTVEDALQADISPTTPTAQFMPPNSDVAGHIESPSQDTTPTTSHPHPEPSLTTDPQQDERPPRLVHPTGPPSDPIPPSMSPVSTLGVEIDPKDRISGIGPDGKFISRAESVSTTGLSRNPTVAAEPNPRFSFARSESLAEERTAPSSSSLSSPISLVGPETGSHHLVHVPVSAPDLDHEPVPMPMPVPDVPQHAVTQTENQPKERRRRFSFEDEGESTVDHEEGETNTNIAVADLASSTATATGDGDDDEQHQPVQTTRSRASQPMSSFEQLCEFGDFSPGSIKLPSSHRPQLHLSTSESPFSDRHEKPLPQPPQVVDGAQYKSLLGDAVNGRATLVDASPRNSQPRRQPQSHSYSHSHSQSRVASAPLNSPVASPTSPVIGNRAATVTATTRHASAQNDLTALPQPPTLTKKSKTTWATHSKKPNHNSTHPPQPVPIQSGSTFANLVSKIQRGHQANTPSFSGMKNFGHKFQAFKADVQKSSQKGDVPTQAQFQAHAQVAKGGGDDVRNAENSQQRQQQQHGQAGAGAEEKLPPLEPPPPLRTRTGRSGSFSMLDAKKAVVQKFLKRSGQPAAAEQGQGQQDEGAKKKGTRMFNNFLGKSNEQSPPTPGTSPHSPSTQPTGTPRNNHPQQRHDLLSQLQHLRQSSREEPRPNPDTLVTGRPRYYQGQQQPGTANTPRHSPSPSLGSFTTPSSPVRSPNTYSPFPPSQTQRGRQGFPHHRTHTADLHLRSRSPLSQPPDSRDAHTPTENRSDPASNLGTFYSASPKVERVGDQEKPWNLALPRDQQSESDDRGTDRGRASTAASPSPVVPARLALPESGAGSPVNPAAANMPPPAPPKLPLPPPTSNPNPSPSTGTGTGTTATPRTEASSPGLQRNTTTITTTTTAAGAAGASASGTSSPTADQLRQSARQVVMEPVELPVPGDDSSEEIVMSSTAYPGQEWRPAYVDGWD